MTDANAEADVRGPVNRPSYYGKAGVFLWGTLVGTLSGLIGLGGAEFRLPILISFYKFRTLQAVIVNLFLSLVTVVFSFIFRAGAVNLDRSHMPVILDLLVGTLIGSVLGVRFASRIREELLTKIVAIFLGGLSFVLIAHDLVFSAQTLVLTSPVRFVLGTLAGIIIGVFSSMLGVAGGELIIPTLVLLFSMNIKPAGSVSLAISIPTIIMGIVKYRGQGKTSGLPIAFIVWMSIGSVLGALLGSRLLVRVEASTLQVLLGLILLISAVKVWRGHSTVQA